MACSTEHNRDLSEPRLVESLFREEYKEYLRLSNSQYSSFGVQYNSGTLFRNKILSRFQEENIEISGNIQWVMRSFYAYRDYEQLTTDRPSVSNGIELDREFNHRGFPKDNGALWTPVEHIDGERIAPDGMSGNHPVILYITPLSPPILEKATKLSNAFSEVVYVVYTNGNSEYVDVSVEEVSPDHTISSNSFPSNTDFDRTLKSLYVINKQAKKHANDAKDAYSNHQKATASHYSSQKSRLYALKATVLNTIHGFSDNIEKHVINGEEYFCLYFTDFGGKNWSFHIPTSDAQFTPDVRESTTIDSFDTDASFDATTPDSLGFDPIQFLTDKFTGTYRFANSP